MKEPGCLLSSCRVFRSVQMWLGLHSYRFGHGRASSCIFPLSLIGQIEEDAAGGKRFLGLWTTFFLPPEGEAISSRSRARSGMKLPPPPVVRGSMW